jgi:hypothetical protein
MKQPLLQSAIVWPEEYLPGTTDNFASNEIIVSGLTAAQIWAQLDDTTLWPGYYSNVADIHFHDGSGPTLSANARFRFSTFGFPIEAQITNVPPAAGQAARVSLHGWASGMQLTRLDVIHAWLFEDLPGGAYPHPGVAKRRSGAGVGAYLAQSDDKPPKWTCLAKSARGE